MCLVDVRFNGEDFLSRIHGKSIMFVGDSLSLNQWQSLTCMLHKSVPDSNYTLNRVGGLSTFTFPVSHIFYYTYLHGLELRLCLTWLIYVL